jgi:3-dehydroquinate dehydratase/shikimate dehydrogenase
MAVVVSLLEPDLASLRAAMDRNAPLADLFELRLDRLGNPGEGALADLIGASPRPVIVTVHGPEAHGDYEGSLDERFELLHAAARAGALFVDIDWQWSLDLGDVHGKCHRIVSRHEKDGTPVELLPLWEAQRDVLYEGDVIKLVTHAATTSDGLRVLRFLREQSGLIAFASGEAGSFTRLLAPVFGSPFTYCAPKAPSPRTAPGQLRVDDFHAAVPPGGLGPGTAIFGVVGQPVAHSWSPRLFNMAMKAAHLDAIYLPFEADSLEELLALADDENFRGFSVTAPHKLAALSLASSAERGAEQAGAANTLVRDPAGGWLASNSDVTALRQVLEASLLAHAARGKREIAPSEARVLVFGAGGAARAAAQATREVGARLHLAARRDDPARELAERFRGQHVPRAELAACEYDVLVHCTPAGSLARPDELPFEAELLRPERIVIEANYRPMLTPLLAAARERDCTLVPGGEWFVRQAMEQFQRFCHQEPDENLMRKTFEHAYDESRRPAATGS